MHVESPGAMAAIVGDDAALRAVLARARRVAPTTNAGAGDRRERHRQGAARARAPRAAARARPARSWRSTAARSPRELARERALRPRARRVHRRRRPPARLRSRRRRAARCSSTRSASCRSSCSPSCCACSRPGASAASAAPARRAARRARGGDDLAQPRRARCSAAASAPTSTTGWPGSSWSCRRCAGAAAISPCWCATSCARSNPRLERASSIRPRWRRWRAPTGRATCASCATSMRRAAILSERRIDVSALELPATPRFRVGETLPACASLRSTALRVEPCRYPIAGAPSDAARSNHRRATRHRHRSHRRFTADRAAAPSRRWSATSSPGHCASTEAAGAAPPARCAIARSTFCEKVKKYQLG